jgi:succinyl-CoA synthetase beta subunit
MKIHEYQAVALLGRYGVATPGGQVAYSADEAVNAAQKLGEGPYILKAQVHAGGRGAAGGVRRADTLTEVAQIAAGLLGGRLVTRQTGPEGKLVRCLLVTRGVVVKSEYYLSFSVDGGNARIVMLASAAGGTEIEQTAARTPEKLVREYLDISIGLRAYQARRIAARIGLRPGLVKDFIAISQRLYRLFVEQDCSLVEINPLAETGDGRLLALDAKVHFDPNALFRHQDLAAWRDPAEEDPREAAAAAFDLNYISLDGEIGCLVNGAGLAMATMDLIRHFGGRPANFLDVGGSATAAKVAGAFQILLREPGLRGVLVNIFGGIMKCDLIAEGIVTAVTQTGIHVPIVVRLAGTHAELGREIFNRSGLSLTSANTLAEAAQAIVALTRTEGVSA